MFFTWPAILAEKIRNFFNSLFLRDKFIFSFLLLTIVLNFWLFILLIWKINFSLEYIPLHYNIYFGIDFLGSPYYVFILPIFGCFFIAINTILAYILSVKGKVLSYLLIIILILIHLLLLLSAYSLVWLNS